MTVDLMTAVQAYLQDVGVKMNFKKVEGDLATILWSTPEDPINGPSAVDWDLCYAGNAALAMHEYYNRYQTGAASNSAYARRRKTGMRLIQRTNATADIAEQMEAFKALQKYENETLFTLPLYYQQVFVYSK